MNIADQMTTTGQLGDYGSYQFPGQYTNLHYWRRPDCKRMPVCLHCWHQAEGLGTTAGVSECCKCLLRTVPTTLTWTNATGAQASTTHTQAIN